MTLRARYLLRFDDLCPAMNAEMWDRIETFLLSLGIKPLIAVVPDNRDPQLAVAPEDKSFWERIRRLQERGWSIGLHGYEHRYQTQDAGLLGVRPKSEFAGLSESVQDEKITKALGIFERELVRADFWVAPGHSFDAVTVSVLMKHGIHRISDGFFTQPGVDRNGAFWVPQQLWRFRKCPPGIWTICFHHNHWTEADFSRFKAAVESHRSSIVDFEGVCREYKKRRLSAVDRGVSFFFPFLLKGKARLAGAMPRSSVER